ncbi:hypothetical protein J6590_016776 [Homalodisca vitripennis]|nr:hypothetical protein J6590_016776 [Homalodisca vitripennis]
MTPSRDEGHIIRCCLNSKVLIPKDQYGSIFVYVTYGPFVLLMSPAVATTKATDYVVASATPLSVLQGLDCLTLPHKFTPVPPRYSPYHHRSEGGGGKSRHDY